MNESIEISLKVKANNQYCCLPLLNQSSINIYNRHSSNHKQARTETDKNNNNNNKNEPQPFIMISTATTLIII
ncbi:hypothetical protein DERF_005370 [Dermatophagoides farinae]|uniref:Uncharacterized protein n=1 Tax=Dermatophagoides farinae TaxID=6954 RepID=A0A922L734_DERFA|nr:hypothetical protein DERF_005370 [Dermatophagoides farinae]